MDLESDSIFDHDRQVRALKAEVERLRAALDAAITLINGYRDGGYTDATELEAAELVFENSLEPLRANGLTGSD